MTDKDSTKEPKLFLGSIGYRDSDPLCFITAKTVEAFEKTAQELIEEEQELIEEERELVEEEQGHIDEAYFSEVIIQKVSLEPIELVRERIRRWNREEFDGWLKDNERTDGFIFY
jgi:hypothetical protein